MWQDGLWLDTIIPQQDAGTAVLLGAVQLCDSAAELRGVARGARALERPLVRRAQARQRATAVKLRAMQYKPVLQRSEIRGAVNKSSYDWQRPPKKKRRISLTERHATHRTTLNFLTLRISGTTRTRKHMSL